MPTALLQLQCLVRAAPSSQPAHAPQPGPKMRFHGSLHGCGSSLHGCRNSPRGCGSSPHGCRSSPHGCRSTPHGCGSRLHGCRSSPRGCRSSPHVLTAGPLLFRKELLQTCQSFGLRTAKCLTTTAQEKKLKLMLWQELTWYRGPTRSACPGDAPGRRVEPRRDAAADPAQPGGGFMQVSCSTLGPKTNSSKRHAVPRPVTASATRTRCSGYKHLVPISLGRNVVNFGLENNLFLVISSPARSGSVFQDLIFSKIK